MGAPGDHPSPLSAWHDMAVSGVEHFSSIEHMIAIVVVVASIMAAIVLLMRRGRVS